MPLAGLFIISASLAGALAGLSTNLRPATAASAAIAAGTLAVVVRSRLRRQALAVAALLGSVAAWSAQTRCDTLQPSLLEWFDAQTTSGRTVGPVIVEAALVADAVRVRDGVRLMLAVSVVESDGPRPVTGVVQAFVAGEIALDLVDEWTAGRKVRVPVTLRRPQMLRNFGGPSPARQTLRRPFALVGSIKSGALVEVSPSHVFDESAAGIRRRVRQATSRFLAARSAEAAAVTNAILIGDRAGLSDEVELRLQQAGTYHVIAISGGNVALLTVLCFGALRLFVRRTRIVSAGTLALVLAYGWIVGGEASVARAVTVAALYLLASLRGIRPAPVAALGTAALMLVIHNPLVVIDIGAWLSFAATLGIVVFVRKTPGVVRTLVAATVAAEVMLLPVMAAVFGQVSVAGLLLNLVAIPAMAVIQLAGFVLVVVAGIAPAVSDAAAAVGAIAVRALIDSAALVEYWPWLSWRVPATSVWVLLAYYLALSLFVLANRPAVAAVAAATAAVTLAGMLFLPQFISTGRPAHLRLTVLDVGQGDAILLQTPSGHALLVDTGGAPGSFDIGGRVVAPALRALGVSRLDWLALTHGDRDHTGGAPAILRELAPREIWEGIPVPPDPDREQLRRDVWSDRAAWRTMQKGARTELGEVVIDVVHPPPPDWERQKTRNDDSLVLRVRYKSVELWLTGDAGSEFENGLSELSAAPLRVLKVGHHGSRTSTRQALVGAIRPQVAVISAGGGNLFGHPAPEVLARLSSAGATLFRTDLDGAIAVETDGSTLRVQTVAGRSWWARIVPAL